MRNFLLFLMIGCFTSLSAQITPRNTNTFLPKGFAPGEREMMKDYIADIQNRSVTCLTSPPPGSTLRSMAEWEELQSIVITWAAQIPILTEIVRYAREEVEVIIICSNENVVKNQLGGAGVDWSSNVTFIEDNFNSIWVRDYGPNPVYLDEVGELAFVDWIYNRPRPADDKIPEVVANYLGIDNYCTTQVPTDLVHTGGNFMSDGLGTAFSSDLFLEENGPFNEWGTSNHDEGTVKQIMENFMGIKAYPLMTSLPYDVIHHIDMHMKILDEETLLVGQYPQGVADGPQIEANIQYILNNYTTAYGDPFNVIRIPMPPENGSYPNTNGDYRTYANAIFVNKTILVPVYEEQYDTTALRIWEETMPGYNIVGIDCNAIIPSLGAIHCITKEVGVHQPLWISTNRINAGCINEPSLVEAQIKHQLGISNSALIYKTTTSDWTTVDMTNNGSDIWSAEIPGIPQGTKVSYYIESTATDGKTITRPLPGEAGAFSFTLEDCTVSTADLEGSQTSLDEIFPNPANAITCIPVNSDHSVEGIIEVTDVLGRSIAIVFEGQIQAGASKYFINAERYQAGTYIVTLKTKAYTQSQKLIIK
ncbi:MAG: agmatine deiminase [Saprospiraceae bacterium]|jgi:agmatine deiminase